MNTTRKIFIGFLITLSIVLMVVTGVVVYRISKQNAPETSSANAVVDYSGNCVKVISGSVTCIKYTGPADSPYCNENNQGTVSVSAGETYCPNPACEQCEQLDCDHGDGGTTEDGGVRSNNNSACETEEKKQCNEQCSDSEGVKCEGQLECLNGYCRNPVCPTEADCACNTTVSCNEACGQNRICPTGLDCIDNVCRNNMCPTEADCVCNNVVQCNADCDDNNLCLSGLTCVQNKCRNDECSTEADCICNEVVDCGDPCDGNHLCPTGTACTNGICIINDCVGRDDCEQNGCKLPDTAIVDGNNKIILGFLFFVIGVFLLKYNVFFLRKSLIDGVDRVINERTDERINKSRQQFEDGVEEKASKNLSKK